MRHEKSLPPDYFERLFAQHDDPWNFKTSPYEQTKYHHSLRALNGRIYKNALEIGCAIGVLTEHLAAQCGNLLAIDVSPSALRQAKARCRHLPQVEFALKNLPQEIPDISQADLIVISEVAYYWDREDIKRIAVWLDKVWKAGGDMLLVHYTGETDYPLSGDEAVTLLATALTAEFDVLKQAREAGYRLEVWRRIGQ